MVNPSIEAAGKYTIDTGLIFQHLAINFKDFDRRFILDIFKPALESILISNKVFTVAFDGTNGDYLDNYQVSRYPSDLALARSLDRFPIPEYFLIQNRDALFATVIEYGSSYQLHKFDEAYYDLFYSLQLYFTDIMEINEFLSYHHGATFEGDTLKFKVFLEEICIKYKEFLDYKHLPLVKRFLDHQSTNIKPEENDKGFTLPRQVLAISYLLDEIGVNASNADRTEIARFIQFVTGKQTKASNIKNTEIYKKLGSPLSLSDSQTISDLQFVRNYFEKLGCQSIIDKINNTVKK